MAGTFHAGTAELDIRPTLKSFTSELLASLKGPVDEASRRVSADLSARLKSSFKPAQTAVQLGFVALGAAAVLGISHAVDETVRLAGEVKLLSRQLGISVEDASRLRAAGDELGISTSTLSMGFKAMERAVAGNSKAAQAWGITLNDASGKQKPFLQILGETADKYVAVGGGIRGAKLATDLYGRAGLQLLPLLAKGSAGLQEMYQSAEDLGQVMSEKDVASAKALAIAHAKLSEAFQGVALSIGRVFIPMLTFVATTMSKVVAWFNRATGPVKAFVLGLLAVAGAVAGLMLLAKAITVVQGAFRVLSVVMAANPFVLIAAAVATLAVLIVTHWNTIRSRTVAIFGAVKAFMVRVWNDIRNAVLSVVGDLLGWLIQGFSAYLDFWFRFVGAMLHGAAAAFGWIPGIGGKLKGARDAFDAWSGGIISDLNAQAAKFHSWGATVSGQVNNLRKQAAAPIVFHIQTIGNVPAAGGRNSQAFASGGWLMEPVVGFGQRTGTRYDLAEHGPERVVPQGGDQEPSRPAASVAGASITIGSITLGRPDVSDLVRQLRWLQLTGGLG